MLSRYLVLTALTLLSSAHALPSRSSPLIKRDEWDEKGELKFTFSTKTVKIGDISLDKIFEELGNACHETGNCDTGDISIDGHWQEQGMNAPSGPITLILRPAGEYVTWIRNGLLDTLKAAVVEGAQCKEVTNTETCTGGIHNPGCEPGIHERKSTQCEVPAFWAVNYQHPDEPNAAPPSMSVNLSMDESDADVCATMLTSLSAIAGAVNGAAGGVFTMFGLFCE